MRFLGDCTHELAGQTVAVARLEWSEAPLDQERP